jgi:glycosyltransferase involved in cell wall biosynthesis
MNTKLSNIKTMSDNGKPLITIVTVIFNSVDTIEQTLLSIINQTYNNVEYIIIDGGSTDGTIDILKKYDDKIDYWISEADEGLYYAMNKGLEAANGQWVNFMNSGDSFYRSTTIAELFDHDFDSDVVYGDVIFSFDGKNVVNVNAQGLDFFWKGMPFVHQACFVKTSLMKKYPFDTSYKLISDYKSLYNIYMAGCQFHYINIPICNFRAGGLSDNNPKSITELQKMIFQIHKGYNVRLYYYYRYVQCFVLYNFAKLIGQGNYALMRRIKNQLTKKN